MPRAGLDQDVIVATALDLVDDVGLDRLSTRLLAERLGVQSPALYWHFRAKNDVVTAMAEAMMRQLPDAGTSLETLGPRPSVKAVERWLVARGEQFRRVLLSRRDGARIHAGSTPPAAQYPGIEAQLDVLRRLGFSAASAARVTVAISRFVVGWALEEQADHTGGSAPPAADAFPLIAAAFTALEHDDPDVTFTACLTSIVHGLVHAR
ncbi:TetR/AcrR family transcriptional regulator C-terminal domain-containing protein [Jatrophihabitans sp. YIM 134969]